MNKPLAPQALLDALKQGASAHLPTDHPPRFQEGDTVRVINSNPPGHTRHPRYVRGKQGVIVRNLGSFILPDANAHGGGKQPQYVYTVCFTAQAVWGESASPHDKIYVDLFENYLEPAS